MLRALAGIGIKPEGLMWLMVWAIGVGLGGGKEQAVLLGVQASYRLKVLLVMLLDLQL